MLSTIVLTRNEERNIVRCLGSLTFCDEIIVVDDHSTDSTLELAKKHNAKVISHALNDDFAAQRNFAMQQATGDWLLFIDADEVVSKPLQKEILEVVGSTSLFSSYYLRRRDHFWGQIVTHGEVATASTRGLIRLMKKTAGTWNGVVHEVFTLQQITGQLQGYIEHYGHEDISAFLKSVNYYSTLRSRQLQAEGHTVSLFELVSYPIGKFVYTFFWKKGFADRAPGFVYSFMMSFHSFLVRAKVITARGI